MDLQTRKLAFMLEFIKISSEETISKFEALLNVQKKGSAHPFTKEELIRRVQRPEADFENGKFKTTDELLKRFQ